MRKQWMAMLSVIGLAGPAVRAEAQVVKGSRAADAGSKDAAKSLTVKQKSIVSPRDPQGKLNLKQESLRRQNQGGGVAKQNTISATCQQNQNKAAVASTGVRLTKGNAGKLEVKQQNKVGTGKQALTKGAAGKQNQNAPTPK